MDSDQITGGVLALAALGWMATWVLIRVAHQRKMPTPPPERRYYQCSDRRCTARATRIVLMVAGPTEARVVCDSDRDRLTITGAAIDLGDIYRGRA